MCDYIKLCIGHLQLSLQSIFKKSHTWMTSQSHRKVLKHQEAFKLMLVDVFQNFKYCPKTCILSLTMSIVSFFFLEESGSLCSFLRKHAPISELPWSGSDILSEKQYSMGKVASSTQNQINCASTFPGDNQHTQICSRSDLQALLIEYQKDVYSGVNTVNLVIYAASA